MCVPIAYLPSKFVFYANRPPFFVSTTSAKYNPPLSPNADVIIKIFLPILMFHCFLAHREVQELPYKRM